MSITQDQMKFYRSIYVNDSLTNGGRISTTQIVDNSINNLFRNVQSAELDAGIDLYRKFFLKNENPNDLSFNNGKMWISNVSSGEDYFQIAAGTNTDNQAASDDYTEWYGSGVLSENLVAGGNSFSAIFKQASGLPSGSLIRLSNGSQTAEIAMLGSPAWNGVAAVVTLAEAIAENFAKDTTIVSAVLELDDLTPSVANWLESSSAGTYDEVANPLSVFNIGTITESWTLTFTSATAFGVTGAVSGSIGTGSITENFTPVNGASYFFWLDKDGWGGTWTSGDTITFNTIHAAQGIWAKESVPAGTNSLSNNLMKIKFNGESA